jgi:hypothetical protein
LGDLAALGDFPAAALGDAVGLAALGDFLAGLLRDRFRLLRGLRFAGAGAVTSPIWSKNAKNSASDTPPSTKLVDRLNCSYGFANQCKSLSARGVLADDRLRV